jgi:NMD protein affecting ribosome stability and mRNA decay
MPCIECGNEENSYNYLCQECYLKTNPIIESRSRLKLNICKICGSPSVRPDVWYESPQEDQKESFLINSLIELIDYRYKIRTLTDRKIEILEIDERLFEINELVDTVDGLFSIKGIPDLFLPEISVQEPFTVFLKYRKCRNCQLIATGRAVTAKVQIRCIKRQIEQLQLELNTMFSNFQNAKNLTLIPVEEAKLRDGWDLSYYDIKGAIIVSDFLKNQFGAHILKTREIITYDRTKNKNKTRAVFSVRLPEYIIGDIIIFEDRPLQIVEINTVNTKFYDFTTKEILSKSNEQVLTLNINILYSRDQLTKMQVISFNRSDDSVQLMNLSTYEYFELPKSDFKYPIKEGFEVLGFTWNDFIFIDQINPKDKIVNQIV